MHSTALVASCYLAPILTVGIGLLALGLTIAGRIVQRYSWNRADRIEDRIDYLVWSARSLDAAMVRFYRDAATARTHEPSRAAQRALVFLDQRWLASDTLVLLEGRA